MIRFILLFIVFFPTGACADLDRATAAYDAGNYATAVAEAEAALNGRLSDADRLYARELRSLGTYFNGGAGAALLEEMTALEADVARGYGGSAPQRLEPLFATADLAARLGRIDAANDALVRAARVALTLPDGIEDALWAYRGMALNNAGRDPSTALAYAALFEFQTTELVGADSPWAMEATAMMALALLDTGQRARAAERFLRFERADWDAFARLSAEDAELVDEMASRLNAVAIREEEARIAEILETTRDLDRLIDETAALLERGPSDFASPSYVAALKRMNAYLDLAAPEDPLVAAWSAMVVKSRIEVGDFDTARPYLSQLLATPAPILAALEIGFPQLVAVLALKGGGDDALMVALIGLAQEVERIVPQGNLEIPFDLAFSLGQIYERQGNEAAALEEYQTAIAVADDTDPSGWQNFGPALLGTNTVLETLERSEEAEAMRERLRDHAVATDNTKALGSALGSMSLGALAAGDDAAALAHARERLASAVGKDVPDAMDVQLAYATLATNLLGQSDVLTDEIVEAISGAMEGPPPIPELREVQSLLLQMAAQLMDARPETIAEAAVFTRADPHLQAEIVAILGEAAVDRADYSEAHAWAELGRSLAPEGSDEAFRLSVVSGRSLLGQGQTDDALLAFRAITDARLLPAAARGQAGAADHVPYHLAAAYAFANDPATGADLRFQSEMFLMAQLASTTSAGDALSSALARSGADEGVAALLRRREALVRDLDQLSAAIAQARYDGLSPEAMIERKARLRSEFDALSKDIAARAPDFARVSAPNPLRMTDVASRLREDEVLAIYVSSDAPLTDGGAASFLIALTQDSVFVSELAARADLVVLTRALRCSAALTDPKCAEGGRAPTRGSFTMPTVEADAGPAFDSEAAHFAYTGLIAAMEEMLVGKSRLIIVPDQALLSLPFHLTLKEPLQPGQSVRNAQWLIRDISVEIAPSVAAFVAMRDAGPEAGRPPRFLGVGDPLIGIQKSGPVPYDCGGNEEILLASVAPETLQRSTGAERVSLISDLAALPDARCELTDIASRFKASDLLLHAAATETALKDMSASGALRQYSVLSFATHGLVAGEIGVNDSGLVMTPPMLPTANDDGLLTTAEIAELDLDAEFVVLSACNTASGDSVNDEGLSGLASAFFSAGAESLLVSHWPVYSDAAVRLTTSTFDALRANPEMPRAEALRRAMLAVLDDPASDARTLHPAYWGPFMIVGDGLGLSR